MSTLKNSHRKKTLELMFRHGAEDHELVRCFKESKTKLILAKAKAQNLPKSKQQALEMLLSLNNEAMSIVRDWFYKNVRFENLHSPERALEILQALPLSRIESEDFKEEWRSVLSLFSGATIPPSLAEFLEGKDNPKSKQVVPAHPEPNTLPAAVVPVPLEQSGFLLTRDMVAACQKSISAEQDLPAGNALAALLDGVMAANRKDQAACQHAQMAVVHAAGALGPDLQDLIFQLEKKSSRTGLRVKNALNKKEFPDLDPESVGTVAEIKKHLPTGEFFARVIAMVSGQDLIELTVQESRETYPLTGDVIAFPNTIPGHHQDGELAIWRVEQRNTDKKNQFVITAFLGRVYEVVAVPHPSTDPDGVREWLQGSYQHSPARSPIFELADQTLVRLPGDLRDPRQFKFDKPVELFESLDAVKLSDQRRVILGPLPVAAHKLDCAPATTIIKRLLKAHDVGDQFPMFSRTQVQALCELVAIEEDDPIKASLGRAKERLGAISDLKEHLNDVISEIISLPAVSNRIEEEKTAILKKFAEEQAQHQSELDRLKSEKSKMVVELAAAQKSLRNQEQELAKQIKETFQKAQQEGIKTLAKAALFRGLISSGQQREPDLGGAEASGSIDRLATLESGKPLISTHDLRIALERASYATGHSVQLMTTVISAARACGAVGLVGSKREAIIQVISTVLAAGVRCSISVSADMFSLSDLLRSPALVKAGDLSIGMPLGEFLESQSSLGRCSVVELIGANRAPPESYLPDLIDVLRTPSPSSCVAWTGMGGQIKTTSVQAPVVLILGFVSGKSTFPLTDPLSLQIPIMGVDIPWGDEQEPDESILLRSSQILTQTWVDLGLPNGEALPQKISTLDAKTRLSIALHHWDCSEPGNLARVLLQGGRLDHMPNLSEGDGSTSSLIKKLDEELRSSSSTLFALSSKD